MRFDETDKKMVLHQKIFLSKEGGLTLWQKEAGSGLDLVDLIASLLARKFSRKHSVIKW
jgi:hypothetical protein